MQAARKQVNRPAIRRLFQLMVLGMMSSGLVHCGSRTGLRPLEESLGPVQSCVEDSDCEQTNPCATLGCLDGFCQPESTKECLSDNPCLTGECNPDSGECEFSPVTEDLDGDGFLSPLPGTIAGQPNSCGRDCDDTSARANPRETEVCDGVDNDCDGVVDNGSTYLSGVTPGSGIVPVATTQREGAGGSSLAYGDGTFVAGYWARTEVADQQLSYLRGFTAEGQEAFEETLMSEVRAPSFGPVLAWSGKAFGAVLSDTRTDGSYEIYFARFNAGGQKLGPDVRLTDAAGMSVHEHLIYDQGQYVVVFDDHRELSGTPDSGDRIRVFAQLIAPDGTPLGDNALLSDAGFETSEHPKVAATPERFGVVYVASSGTTSATEIHLKTFEKDFSATGPRTVIWQENGRFPSVTALRDGFLVAWELSDGVYPGSAIWGAFYSPDGTPLMEPQPLTEGGSFARSHAVLPLGDRFVLFWSDHISGNYELYAKVLSLDFEVIEPRVRITDDPANTIGPVVAAGEDGRVGVMFDDWRSGTHKAYFTTIGCNR